MPAPTSIHHTEAIRLLRDGSAHDLRLWKLSTGDILHYKGAVAIGRYTIGASTRVKLLNSGAIRTLRNIALFEIDDLQVYL